MSKVVVNDFAGQFQHAIKIYYEEVGRFSDGQWVVGFEYFQDLTRQAIHLLECLEFNFAV